MKLKQIIFSTFLLIANLNADIFEAIDEVNTVSKQKTNVIYPITEKEYREFVPLINREPNEIELQQKRHEKAIQDIRINSKDENIPLYVNQIFTGYYICSQGKTDLNLIIKDIEGNNIYAIFDFFHEKSQAKGSFNLTGTYNKTNQTLDFKPGAWINNPNNYYAVGMEGTLINRNTVYQGKIKDKNCKDFKVVDKMLLEKLDKHHLEIEASNTFIEKKKIETIEKTNIEIKTDSSDIEFFDSLEIEEKNDAPIDMEDPLNEVEKNSAIEDEITPITME